MKQVDFMEALNKTNQGSLADARWVAGALHKRFESFAFEQSLPDGVRARFGSIASELERLSIYIDGHCDAATSPAK